MSVHKHIYLGPYAECTYRDETRQEPVWGCTNKACKKHPTKRGPEAEGAFCAVCGSPNGKILVTVKVRQHRYDVVGDALTDLGDGTKTTVYLAPNERRAGDPTPDIGDEELHLDLRTTNAAAEIAWFEGAFADELVKLRKAYATVTVKWGLHQYFM